MKKILIVDDEKDFCEVTKMRIESSGDFGVLTCFDSLQALKLAKKEHPDLILLDVMMPGKDGPQIAAELRADKDTKGIPVVFLTAILDREEARLKSNLIGGEYFIAKPVDSKELLSIINELAK